MYVLVEHFWYLLLECHSRSPHGFVCLYLYHLASPGYFCDNSVTAVGSLADQACPEGYYCPLRTEYYNQYPCPSGTFNNKTHRTEEADCQLCLPGYYCQSTGLAEPEGLCYPGWGSLYVYKNMRLHQVSLLLPWVRFFLCLKKIRLHQGSLLLPWVRFFLCLKKHKITSSKSFVTLGEVLFMFKKTWDYIK